MKILGNSESLWCTVQWECQQRWCKAEKTNFYIFLPYLFNFLWWHSPFFHDFSLFFFKSLGKTAKSKTKRPYRTRLTDCRTVLKDEDTFIVDGFPLCKYLVNVIKNSCLIIWNSFSFMKTYFSKKCAYNVIYSGSNNYLLVCLFCPNKITSNFTLWNEERNNNVRKYFENNP